MNRTERDLHDIYGLFSQMTFFRQLPATSVHKLAKAAGYGIVESDTPIVVQGDVRCNAFYVVLSGSVSVHTLPPPKHQPLDSTLEKAKVFLPKTCRLANELAKNELHRESLKYGPKGDESMSNDELYIRHEHRKKTLFR
jgi:hypothetical protein